jgi:hypothetical protein
LRSRRSACEPQGISAEQYGDAARDASASEPEAVMRGRCANSQNKTLCGNRIACDREIQAKRTFGEGTFAAFREMATVLHGLSELLLVVSEAQNRPVLIIRAAPQRFTSTTGE